MSKATDKSQKNIFSERLAKLIKDNGYIHENVAQGIEVTRQAVGKWVNGDSLPDILTTAKLAKFFGVSVDYLAGLTDTPTNDMNLRTVCDYTGLNQESVENIVNHIIEPAPIMNKYTNSEVRQTIFTGEYYKLSQKIVNTVLSSVEFWNIVFHYNVMVTCGDLYNKSQENFEMVAKKIINGEVAYSDVENIVKETAGSCDSIDVCRYAITRQIEQISDIFDIRVDSPEKEAADNGKHTCAEE
jgi:transcriptional regulator with XRE-family HTH domain